jgi:hypothetical protein
MAVAMVAMVTAITRGEDEGVIIERRQQNEEVTFWNNTFGVDNCRSYSSDVSCRYTHWDSSATTATHHISRTARGNSVT